MKKIISVMGLTLALALPSTWGKPAPPVISLNTRDSEPVVIRSGSALNAMGMAMRRTSGTLYLPQAWNGWRLVEKVDSSVTKKLSESDASSNDPRMGTIMDIDAGRFDFRLGAVSGGVIGDVTSFPGCPAWIPTTDTMAFRSTPFMGSAFAMSDVLSQTAAEGLGVVNEGKATAKGGPAVNTGAWAAQSTSGVGVSYQGESPFAWADHVAINGGSFSNGYDRLLGAKGSDQVVVYVVRDSITGWTTTTNGYRSVCTVHNNNLTAATLLDNNPSTGFPALVPGVNDTIRNLAVYSNTLYVLSSDGNDTYLSAVKYKLPTDGITPVSVAEVVDLDVGNTTNVWLNLDSQVPGIDGKGMDFGSVAGDTLMYVASGLGRIYTFKVINPPARGTVIFLK